MRAARENERVWFETHGETYGTERAKDEHADTIPDTTAPNVGTDALVNALVRVLGGGCGARSSGKPSRPARAISSSSSLGWDPPRRTSRTAARSCTRSCGCDAYERAFADELDAASSARASRSAAAEVALFETTLHADLRSVDLEAFYDPKRVRAVVDASDEFQRT